MIPAFINMEFLQELANEGAQGSFGLPTFRLPSLPELPANYRGAAHTPKSLVALARQADAEMTRSEKALQLAKHYRLMARSFVFGPRARKQAKLRENYYNAEAEQFEMRASALFIAIDEAVFI